MFNISSMLSARLFQAPKLVKGRIYFISNLSGHLSLYAMDVGGSVPEPLLPASLALQNPHLIDGPFDLWGLRVTPVPVMHGNLPILGYRFRDVAYITDVSEIPETSFSLLEDLDLLILDALRYKPHPTHLSLEQALATVERLKPRRALFTHVAHELGHEATNARLPSHVRLAYDGLKLEL